METGYFKLENTMITGKEPSNPSGDHTLIEPYNGLTIHQHFTIEAMKGILSSGTNYKSEADRKSLCSDAINIADTLIEALNFKENEKDN